MQVKQEDHLDLDSIHYKQCYWARRLAFTAFFDTVAAANLGKSAIEGNPVEGSLCFMSQLIERVALVAD